MGASRSKRHSTARLANILGSFGYLSVLVQWFWVTATIIIPYLQHSSFKSIFMPTATTSRSMPVQSIALPAGIQVAAMIAAIVFVGMLIIYAIYAIPRSVGKLGKNVTQKSATATVQHITHHHQPLTEIEKKRAYEYLTWGMKLLLMIIPFALSFIPTHQSLTLSHAIVLSVSLFCLGTSVLWFGLQGIIALIYRISARDIW